MTFDKDAFLKGAFAKVGRGSNGMKQRLFQNPSKEAKEFIKMRISDLSVTVNCWATLAADNNNQRYVFDDWFESMLPLLRATDRFAGKDTKDIKESVRGIWSKMSNSYGLAERDSSI